MPIMNKLKALQELYTNFSESKFYASYENATMVEVLQRLNSQPTELSNDISSFEKSILKDFYQYYWANVTSSNQDDRVLQALETILLTLLNKEDDTVILSSETSPEMTNYISKLFFEKVGYDTAFEMQNAAYIAMVDKRANTFFTGLFYNKELTEAKKQAWNNDACGLKSFRESLVNDTPAPDYTLIKWDKLEGKMEEHVLIALNMIKSGLEGPEQQPRSSDAYTY